MLCDIAFHDISNVRHMLVVSSISDTDKRKIQNSFENQLKLSGTHWTWLGYPILGSQPWG